MAVSVAARGDDLNPAAERLRGGTGTAAVFAAPVDPFDTEVGLNLILVGAGAVVETDQVELVEFCRGRFKTKVAAAA